MSHPNDDVLALLLESNTEHAAERAHVDGCPACRARVDELRALARMIGDVDTSPSVVPDVLSRVKALEQRRPLAFLPVLAAVACVLVLVPLDSPDGMTARGGEHRTQLALVVDGASAPRVIPRNVVLRADLAHPRTDAPLVVIARDANGAVRWLRPAFTDATRPPACPAVLTASALSLAPETVALELPPGALVVRVLAVARGCDVAALDDALERDALVGDVVDTVTLTVAP